MIAIIIFFAILFVIPMLIIMLLQADQRLEYKHRPKNQLRLTYKQFCDKTYTRDV